MKKMGLLTSFLFFKDNSKGNYICSSLPTSLTYLENPFATLFPQSQAINHRPFLINFYHLNVTFVSEHIFLLGQKSKPSLAKKKIYISTNASQKGDNLGLFQSQRT